MTEEAQRNGRAALDRPAGETERRYSNRVLLKRMLLEARPYWPKMGVLFFLTLLATPLFLLTPVPLKIAVDSVVGSRPLPGFLDIVVPDFIARSDTALLAFAAGLQVFVVLLAQLQRLSSHVLQTQAGEGITLAFRARLFAHLQRLSLAFHDRRGPAESLYRVQWDAPAIQWITISGLIPVISSAVLLVATVYVIARIDWALALVALAVAPLLILFSRAYDKRMRTRYRDVHGLDTSALGVVQESLGAFRVVKAFGREDREQQRFVRRSGESFRARVRLSLFEGGYQLLINTTVAAGAAAVLFIGIMRVRSGDLTLGDVVVIVAYLVQLYVPLAQVSEQVAAMQTALASAERSFEVLDEPPDVRERPGALPLDRAEGAIAFREVSFSYDGRNRVLHDVSFNVQPGTRVGIAGRTGAGKTTLVNLLARFYDPDSGQVMLDGVDLRDYRVAALRNQLAIVLQEPVLFSTTIAENIGFARPEASDEEIVDAARAANAHHFVADLPEGYDTVVGDRGMRLSGGERQRVALARAFLKDAPILVLDEPTSSVDTQTEATIMEAMERLMAGRTTLMIAHRIATLEHCDAHLEVEDGRLTSAVGL